MWVLGIKLGSSWKASALKHRASSPAYFCPFSRFRTQWWVILALESLGASLFSLQGMSVSHPLCIITVCCIASQWRWGWIATLCPWQPRATTHIRKGKGKRKENTDGSSDPGRGGKRQSLFTSYVEASCFWLIMLIMSQCSGERPTSSLSGETAPCLHCSCSMPLGRKLRPGSWTSGSSRTSFDACGMNSELCLLFLHCALPLGSSQAAIHSGYHKAPEIKAHNLIGSETQDDNEEQAES